MTVDGADLDGPDTYVGYGPDVYVLASWAPKGDRFPQGKRWVAGCMDCKWSVKVGWKGEYRRAWAFATAHRCPPARPPAITEDGIVAPGGS